MSDIFRMVEKEAKLNPVSPAMVPEKGISLVWNAREVCVFSLAISFLLLGLHLFSYFIFFRYPQLGTASLLVQRLGLDRDGNIPTLFTALLLFLSATLLFFIARQAKQLQNKTHRQWLILSLVFVFLGIDEATQVHEFTSSIVKSVNNGPLTGLFRHAWLLPYLVLTVAVGAYFLRFVLGLPARTRNLFFLAGFLYVGSAMGLEMLEGLEATRNGKESVRILQLQTVEEMVEMFAIILFNYTLMHWLQDAAINLHIKGGRGAQRGTAPSLKG